MRSLDPVTYKKGEVEHRAIDSPQDNTVTKQILELKEEGRNIVYTTSEGDKKIFNIFLVDIGSKTTGQRFDLTQDEIDLLFSYPSPEVKVRIANYDVSIYKYDAEVSGDKVFYTNVLIYQDGKRYHVNLDVDRTLTENQAIIYRTEEPIVTEEDLNGEVNTLNNRIDTEVETLNSKIDTKQDTLVAGAGITIDPETHVITAENGGGGGTGVFVDGVKQDRVDFTSDPQTQLNNLPKKVVVHVEETDWAGETAPYTLTITPAMMNLAPSVTYDISMQKFSFEVMQWIRVQVLPNIDQEGNIIIKSQTKDKVDLIITSGLELPEPIPVPPTPPEPVNPKIYGVDKVGRADGHNLPRTDDAVGLTYSLVTEGDNQVYHSDFDNVYPYSDIEEVETSLHGRMIKIPKFYHKYTLNEDGTYKIQISKDKIDETWNTCFIKNGQEIPYIEIGKYESYIQESYPFHMISETGHTPTTDKTINEFRDKSDSNGTHEYTCLFDIWDYQIIKLLFVVEFATTDSQSIMKGYTSSNSAPINTGSCDGILTGSPVSVTDCKHGCTYRGIENLWGNIYKWVDGINFQEGNVYISDDIATYQSDKFDGSYKLSGTKIQDNGYVKTMTPCQTDNKQIFIPTNASGSKYSYYYDNSYYNSGNRVLNVGGDWTIGSSAGLWNWCADRDSSYSGGRIGCRLCYKPNPTE